MSEGRRRPNGVHVVTGGAGFIGSALARRLESEGHQVRVLDDLSTGRRDRLAGTRIEFVEGSILDRMAVDAALRDAEVVYHQAAMVSVVRSLEDPLLNHAVNLTGTLEVLEAARRAKVRRVVLASSSAVYGDAQTLPLREDAPTVPVSPYGWAKLAGEAHGRLHAALLGLDVAALRYFNVYGAGQDAGSPYAAVITRFAQAALADKPLQVFGDGGQTRDFVHVDDVVQANVLAGQAEGKAAGEAVNVATGRGVSVLDLANTLRSLAGSTAPVVHAPARVGEVRHSLGDARKARERFGWTPHVPLEDGLRRLVDALRS